MKKKNVSVSPIHDKAQLLANEVGDSLSKFCEVVYREISSLQFKGYEPVHVNITFQISLHGSPIVVVEILSSRDDTSIAIADKIEESRYFHLVKREMPTIFWLIEMWKEDLYNNHQKLLKSIPLFTQ